MKKQIAVVGAGASGLVATIFAKSSERVEVKLFEKNSKVGKKLLATGNGKCNISNRELKLENFHSENMEFLKRVIAKFSTKDLVNLFRDLGVELVEKAKGRLYPMSEQALTIVEVLEYRALELGVEIELNQEVLDIFKVKDKFHLKFSDRVEVFDRVLIATGGLAMPKLGASESGYRFAKSLSHRVLEPFSSLVKLKSNQNYLKKLSGVKILTTVTLYIDREPKINSFGDTLFREYGLSGSAILDISRVASIALREKREVLVEIDLLPDIERDKLITLLRDRAKYSRDLTLYLMGFLNKKLAKVIIERVDLAKSIESSNQLSRKDFRKLAFIIKSFKVPITGVRGFEDCETTAGGVDTAKIDVQTFESKLCKGVFFAGEVLDVDGDCGGFNLHFAFASGSIAGSKIGKF